MDAARQPELGLDAPLPPFDHPDEDYVPIEETAPDDDGDELGPVRFDPRVNDALAPAARFEARRAELEAKHGINAMTALARDTRAMARDLVDRARAICERLEGHVPNRERLELALRSLESAGALAIALHEKISADLASLPQEQDR